MSLSVSTSDLFVDFGEIFGLDYLSSIEISWTSQL